MLKHRRGSDPIRDSIVIETRDGTRLRCSISAIGRDTEPRWMIIDSSGAQFVGPAVVTDRSPEAISRLIDDWWEARKVKPSDG